MPASPKVASTGSTISRAQGGAPWRHVDAAQLEQLAAGVEGSDAAIAAAAAAAGNGVTVPARFIEQEALNARVLEALLPLHEAWSGVKLRPLRAYGLPIAQHAAQHR